MSPTSLIGHWLRADARHDTATRDRLPPDPADEDAAAVLDAAFELAVRRRFAPDCHVRDITLFVSGIARRYRKVRLPVLEAEMLIREQLGEPVPTGEIDILIATVIKARVVKGLVEDLALFDSELDDLLVEAERLAVARGYHPTPAPGQ